MKKIVLFVLFAAIFAWGYQLAPLTPVNAFDDNLGDDNVLAAGGGCFEATYDGAIGYVCPVTVKAGVDVPIKVSLPFDFDGCSSFSYELWSYGGFVEGGSGNTTGDFELPAMIGSGELFFLYVTCDDVGDDRVWGFPIYPMP